MKASLLALAKSIYNIIKLMYIPLCRSILLNLFSILVFITHSSFSTLLWVKLELGPPPASAILAGTTLDPGTVYITGNPHNLFVGSRE